MTMLGRGLILGAVQVGLVLAIAGKMEVDRSMLPRVWVKTLPVDPYLPIRGRYLSLRLVAEERGFAAGVVMAGSKLVVEGDKLVIEPSEDGSGVLVSVHTDSGTAEINEPVAFFIPDQARDPSRREVGEELWVEVTVPGKGPPRPVRLGVRKGGAVVPMEIR
jgi:hypothetical protein